MLHTDSAALVFILTACGLEKQTTATDAADTSTSGTTAETPTGTTGVPSTCAENLQTDACCCFEAVRFVEPGVLDILGSTTSVCGVHPLCPEMIFECDSANPGCPDGNLSTDDEGAIACSLQALADGQAGRISWSIKNAQGPGGSMQVWFDLVGDGTVFRQAVGSIDMCFDVYAVRRLPLPASTYYEGCLAQPDWRARFDCLRDAPFAEPIETCLDGDEYSAGSPRSRREHERVGLLIPRNEC